PEPALQGLDRRRLQAFRALLDGELDPLGFLQGLETAALDFREVGEEIGAAIVGGDEAETLRFVEPLDRTSCSAHVALHLLRVTEYARGKSRPRRQTNQESTTRYSRPESGRDALQGRRASHKKVGSA